MTVQDLIDTLNTFTPEIKAMEVAVSCSDCGLEETIVCEPEVKSKHVRLFMEKERNK
jgi:hypothetical protein